jgi:hypothetical protein
LQVSYLQQILRLDAIAADVVVAFLQHRIGAGRFLFKKHLVLFARARR